MARSSYAAMKSYSTRIVILQAERVQQIGGSASCTPSSQIQSNPTPSNHCTPQPALPRFNRSLDAQDPSPASTSQTLRTLTRARSSVLETGRRSEAGCMQSVAEETPRIQDGSFS